MSIQTATSILSAIVAIIAVAVTIKTNIEIGAVDLDRMKRDVEALKQHTHDIAGPAGPRGPQGEPGLKGEQGATGPQGIPGRDSLLRGQKYCVLQAGGRCPTHFSSGTICIDSEDDKNKDFKSGVIGDSGRNACGGSSKALLLCCIH